MLKRLVNEARFTLTITTTGPLLVRSGYATLSGPDMTPVLTYRHNMWQVYLPGSSLKGVLRSHLEKVARTLNEDVVCDPFHDLPAADAFCGKKFQARKRADEEISSEVAYRESCPICRLFGSTEFIGRVSINDAYLVDDSRPRPTENRDGVGIDRLTGGAAHGAKFELEVVSTAVAFQTDITLRNFEVWQLGLLLLAVQDMAEGLVRIGSGTSRGLGSVEGQVDSVTISYPGRANGRLAGEVWGLGKFLAKRAYGTWPDDMLSVHPTPDAVRVGIRQQAVYSGESLAKLQQASIEALVTRLENWTQGGSP